ncbi:hypothetical protein JHK87_039754 [Glycine soja]|nr:hypothetical protein JHK87_039754 [Glycine soja]
MLVKAVLLVRVVVQHCWRHVGGGLHLGCARCSSVHAAPLTTSLRFKLIHMLIADQLDPQQALLFLLLLCSFLHLLDSYFQYLGCKVLYTFWSLLGEFLLLAHLYFVVYFSFFTSK